MKIDLMFLSYNRLHYTKLSLPTLLSDPTEEFSLIIWDNGSTDGSREFIDSVQDPRIVKKVLSKENIGQLPAIDEVFGKSSADLIGIVADDMLVTPGWTRPIVQAHAEVPEFGMIACWYLGQAFFDEARAQRKIQKFGCHQVLRHPFTNGGAGLIKVKTLREVGPICRSKHLRHYSIDVARKGYVNGFYFPLIDVEHMEYPWSLYKVPKAGTMMISEVKEVRAWHYVALNIFYQEPWQAKYYVGWRRKWRAVKARTHKNILKWLL